MIRRNKTTLDELKSSTLNTVKKIMQDLAEQKSALDLKEKELKNIEKKLSQKEKSIEEEVASFGRDITSLTNSAKNNFFSKASIRR